MRDERLTPQVTQRVLQLHQLNEQIVLRIQPRSRHGRLQVEAQPLLYAQPPQLVTALCQIEEQHQVKDDWRRQDRIAAQKIHLDLHGIAQPPEDVDVVPALFVIAARRIVVDAD